MATLHYESFVDYRRGKYRPRAVLDGEEYVGQWGTEAEANLVLQKIRRAAFLAIEGAGGRVEALPADTEWRPT
jgi:hypothetical protein